MGGIVQTPTFESLQKKTQNKTNNTKNVQDSPQLGVLSNYLWELHCPFYAEIRSNSLIQSTTLQFYHFFYDGSVLKGFWACKIKERFKTMIHFNNF